MQREFGIVHTYPKYVSAATGTSILKIESYTCLKANWVLYLHNAVHTNVNFKFNLAEIPHAKKSVKLQVSDVRQIFRIVNLSLNMLALSECS